MLKHKIWLNTSKNMMVFEKKALVIGAGLAGCSTAYSLAKRGWLVDILDKEERPALGASQNRQAVLTIKPSNALPHIKQLWNIGQSYTKQLLESILLEKKGVCWDWLGVFYPKQGFTSERCLTEAYKQHLSSEFDPGQTSPLSLGGWVDVPALCKKMIDHPNITFHPKTDIDLVERIGSTWTLTSKKNKRLSASVLIVSNGHLANQLFPSLRWSTRVMRGQLSYIKKTDMSPTWRMILYGNPYLTPALESRYALGATHQLDDYDLSEREQDHDSNWKGLAQYTPEICKMLGGTASKKPSSIQGWVGLRCVTQDKLPIIGSVVSSDEFCKQYHHLKYDALARFNTEPPYLPGCYVTIGHGFKGLTTAPLSGELIAMHLNNEPSVLPELLMQSISPSRFLARQLIRNQLKNSY